MDAKCKTCVCLLQIIWFACFTQVQTLTWESSDALVNKLLDGYNKWVRPIEDQTKPVYVSINFVIYSILELDEINSRLSVAGTLELIWVDENLAWDPTASNYIYSVMLPAKDIWIPPIELLNPDGSAKVLNIDSQSIVRVLDSGVVLFFSSGIFSVSTSFDTTYFPYDKQICEVLFYVPLYIVTELDLVFAQSYVSTSFEKNGEWAMTNHSKSRSLIGTTPVVMFTFELERQSTYMIMNIILPIMFLEIINILVFVLPAESGERVSFAVTLLLSLSVFMTLVGDNLPKTSDPLPILSYYLLSTLTTSTLMCVVAILNLAVFHRTSTPHRFIARIANLLLCRSCCGSSKSNKVSAVRIEQHEKPPLDSVEAQASDKSETTWADVSSAIDRIALVVFIIVLISINAYFLSVLRSNAS